MGGGGLQGGFSMKFDEIDIYTINDTKTHFRKKLINNRWQVHPPENPQRGAGICTGPRLSIMAIFQAGPGLSR